MIMIHFILFIDYACKKIAHLWPNSFTRVFVTIQTSGNQPVVIHGRNERIQYLVPNVLMMSGDSRSLY